MPTGPFALLRHPQFLRLWLVGGLAGTMRWLELLAIGVWAFELTRSALVVALPAQRCISTTPVTPERSSRAEVSSASR